MSNNKISIFLFIYFLIIALLIILVKINPRLNFYKDLQQVEHWSNKVTSCLVNKVNCEGKSFTGRIILIGDSHAAQLYIGMSAVYQPKNVILLTDSLFQPSWNLTYSLLELSKVNDYLDKNLDSTDLILVAFAQHHLFQRRYSENNRSREIENILSDLIPKVFHKSAQLILVNDNPRLSINLPISVCSKQILRTGISDCDITKVESLEQRKPLSNLLEKLAGKFGVKIYDITPIVCPSELCQPLLNDREIFSDQNHLTAYGSEMVARNFKDTFQLK